VLNELYLIVFFNNNQGVSALLDNRENGRYPYYFLVLYALVYMTNSIYGTFIPVYLNGIGFSQTVVGTLLSIGPLISVFANSTWGLASDRAPNKNRILKILVLGSAAAMAVYPLSRDFLYLFVIISVFTFFQTSINPISDTITLEYIEARRWKYGPIRMSGTLGFAFMSITAGLISKQDIRYIFVLYFCVGMLILLVVFRLPLVKGHQSQGTKVSPWSLFKNRELVTLIAFYFVIQLTFGFYFSFFPIYFKQSGASNSLLGLAMFITSTSEVPFLLFAEKILSRLGVKLTLVLSALVISLRWMLLHFVTDLNAILIVNATHGLTFIVFMYSMATFINRNVPKELRATGQTMNALLCMGIARTIGSSLGGVISDKIGIKQVFLYTSSVAFTAAVVFGAIFLHQSRRKAAGNAGTLSDTAAEHD
jgi:PPP family 3-phenylpropionic acid transporter